MATNQAIPGYKLPVNADRQQGKVATGFVTPKQDRVPQVMGIPPRRAIPVIFLPGTMGTNLRVSAARQKLLQQKNNIAWRPDHKLATYHMADDTATQRQLRLDPDTTEVDSYDPIGNPTGDPNESSAARNDQVFVSGNLYLWGNDGGAGHPTLTSDLHRGGKTGSQKACERGWGEVFFDSYGQLLTMCEGYLNAPFRRDAINPFWMNVIGVAPQKWEAHSQPSLTPLDEATFREAVKGVWFPVHAMGYNWLHGNGRSGVFVADRIRALIKSYAEKGFQCEKVILVTHSMGGLVARAVIHPMFGDLNDSVLGIVHGVMPAIGAGAAYKRMRCGVEGTDLASKVVGNMGSLITAVLGNAQGGLELLPNQAYGNGWLKVTHQGKTLKSLPTKGDPYAEIYKLKDQWFGLLSDRLLNPAKLDNGPSFAKTCILLDGAKAFHEKILNTYHHQSYAHFGADPGRASWHHVAWRIEDRAQVANVDSLTLVADNDRGALRLSNSGDSGKQAMPGLEFGCSMDPAADPGDQTVPAFSADHQLRSGTFRGIFRQRGYEHQHSYKDRAVLNATLYSLIKIASTMVWQK